MEFGAFCLFPYPWPEEAYRILINVILLDSKNIFKIIIFVCQKKKITIFVKNIFVIIQS